jgi:predicted nucleic acid-binding protein
MKKIFIDSDIFVRDLRYPRDINQEANQRFLEKVRSGKIRGATSIFNLLEICGILSFNLTLEALWALYRGFPTHYNVKILYPADAAGNLQYDIARIFEKILKKQDLGDAQIASVAERFSNQLNGFVSWNARHFEGKISLSVKTPADFQ